MSSMLLCIFHNVLKFISFSIKSPLLARISNLPTNIYFVMMFVPQCC